ncbi:ATP-binding protein [Streptomyces bobili]|uniref:ATP-binding protein n=1 Tax=Streptomyces bobili TaxID=67280 RepID=UPI00382AA1CE
MRSWGLPLEPTELVDAELAANTVTHGRVPGRDFRLLMYVIGGTLRVEVTDTRSDRLPVVASAPGDGESGRGLLLVEALAARWGVGEGPAPRKIVWAEVVLQPDPENLDFGAGDGPNKETTQGKETRPSPTPPAR